MCDLTTIRRILNHDPIWAAYALADLQPAFLPYCHWSCAESAEGPGLALLYDGLEPPVLLTAGTGAAIAEALAQMSLPKRVYLSIREDDYRWVEQWYDNRDDYRPMARMALAHRSDRSAPAGSGIVRLSSADADSLRALYRHGGPFTPDAFAPYQLDNGVFFGRFDDQGMLEAAGGTHIVNRAERVAAIGNLYTRPDCRGRGYAKAISRALLDTLEDQNIANVVLNVDQRNTGARFLYEKLGFAVHCPFVEGIGIKRAQP